MKKINNTLKNMIERYKETSPDTGSDFGKGFIYNLILFTKHYAEMQTKRELYKEMSERYPALFDENEAVQLWFNGASDHFYEFEIPEKYKDTEISKIACYIRDKSLDAGHGSGLMARRVELKEYTEIFDKLEELSMLIDKELGVEDIEARWK